MHSVLISVIVPIYNVEKYLQNCLDSLINQTFSNWEAILVDDGSTDNSGKICDEYALLDNRFKVIHKENGGQSSARNIALDMVNGPYVTYLDSDDFLANNAFQILYDIAIQYEADIVQCNSIRGSDTSFPSILDTHSVSVHTYDNHTIFTKFAAKIIPWGKLYKREVIGNIRFPEGLINEDDFTVWKYYYNAKRIIVTNTPLYYYSYNPNSTMAQKVKRPNFKYFDAYRERIKFFQDKYDSELEAVSRIQWMKSLVLTYSNNMLTGDQRMEVVKIFRQNYKTLKQLPFNIPAKLSNIFWLFNILPMFTSNLVVKLYNR